ncbi:16771_t:CDS:2 [Rhizophagus irregularis]|nr:16771_t:CDS:2 [Rhizophagus irregularis]
MKKKNLKFADNASELELWHVNVVKEVQNKVAITSLIIASTCSPSPE